MLEKQCKKCGEWFPADNDHFYLSNKRKDGFETRCIVCYRTDRGWPILNPPTDQDRFWAKVNKDGPIVRPGLTKCWEWTAYIMPNGYGQFQVGRVHITAHRFSYELAHGNIPDGLLVCHHCDNPPCVNPDHLFLGTTVDNALDMMAKGRGKGHYKGGTDHPYAKLTLDNIERIIDMHKRGYSYRKLAAVFNVHHSRIWAVVTGKYRPARQEANL